MDTHIVGPEHRDLYLLTVSDRPQLLTQNQKTRVTRGEVSPVTTYPARLTSEGPTPGDTGVRTGSGGTLPVL